MEKRPNRSECPMRWRVRHHKALFVSAFPQHLTMKTLESPSVAVYITMTWGICTMSDWYQVCVSCHCQTDFFNEFKKCTIQCTKLKKYQITAFPFYSVLGFKYRKLQCIQTVGWLPFPHPPSLACGSSSQQARREHDQSVFLCVCLFVLFGTGWAWFLTSIIVMRKELVLTRF